PVDAFWVASNATREEVPVFQPATFFIPPSDLGQQSTCMHYTICIGPLELEHIIHVVLRTQIILFLFYPPRAVYLAAPDGRMLPAIPQDIGWMALNRIEHRREE